MTHLSIHLPLLSRSVFTALLDKRDDKYFIIRSTDSSHQKSIKNIGNVGTKTFYTLALIITTITLPFFLLADLIYKPWARPTLPHCHYQVNSSLFPHYLKELQGHIEKAIEKEPYLSTLITSNHPFEKEVGQLIEFIRTAKRETAEDKLRFHQEILDTLRTLLEKKGNYKNQTLSVQFIENLSEWLYTGLELTVQMDEFFHSHALPPDLHEKFKTIEEKTLSQFLKESHKQLARNIKKFGGVPNTPLFYDPHRLGDTPSILFELSYEGRRTKFIRTPAITKDLHRGFREESLKAAEVVPEFKGFLDRKRPHLYVNLMRFKSGSEKIRSEAIQQLESEYPDTFYLIGLDKDSHFYHQKQTKESVKADDFKKIFLEKLFCSDSLFRWPSKLKTSEWQTKCEQVIEKIHTEFFEGQDALKIDERKDFIEIVYCCLVEEAIKTLKPDTCNISCRSTIDRGASMLASVYAYHHLKNNEQLSHQDCRQIAAMTLSPALLMQSRTPFSVRIDRISSFLDKIIARSQSNLGA